jgi:cytoskeleton protein RodZ
MMEHQNNSEPGNMNNAAPQASLGTMLREAREHLNLSVAEVAAQIKFAPRQIEALESDDFRQLPEVAFLRGFVRSYAKILNLDAKPLLAALPQEKAAAAELIPASVEVPYPVDNTSQRQNLILLGAALLLAVIAVGFSVWHFTNPQRQSTVAKLETPVPLTAEKQVSPEPMVQKQITTAPSNPAEPKRQSSLIAEQTTSRPENILPEKPKAVESSRQSSATAAQSSVRATKTKAKAVASVAQSSVPVAKTKAEASATVAQSSVRAAKTKAKAIEAAPQTQTTDSGNKVGTEAPNTVLKLVFDEESWAEIKDKDGNMISSQINPRGSELNVKGQLPLSLVIGHAATTHVYKNGQPVDMSPYINSSSEVARFTLQ